MKKVLTVGVFDLLHIGHVELFRRAKALGDYLIVAVQNDDYILKFKPEAQTVNNTAERCYMVKAIKYVNDVVAYNDVQSIVREVDFDIFVTGPDQNHEGFVQAKQWCKEHGKEVVVLPRTDGVSSSELKHHIKAL